jgi:alpha-ribazole phosphatase/probable phosphoglycerate mutase
VSWTRPPGVTRLILVRHGETEEAARGRCVGRLDVGLSDRGRRQAAELAVRLREAGLAAIYASTSRRALDTAAPTAAACGLEVRQLEELCEVSFGALEGLPFEEVEARFPRSWRAWMTSPVTVCFPGGESLASVQERARRAREALISRHAAETVVAFSHGGPLRALLGDALGLPDPEVFGIAVPHGSAVVLEWTPGSKGPGRLAQPRLDAG